MDQLDSALRWALDFTGVHNGENRFSTEMYNFWSGFGGNVSLLAVSGAIVGVYRHNLRRLGHLNPMRLRGARARRGRPPGEDED